MPPVPSTARPATAAGGGTCGTGSAARAPASGAWGSGPATVRRAGVATAATPSANRKCAASRSCLPSSCTVALATTGTGRMATVTRTGTALAAHSIDETEPAQEKCQGAGPASWQSVFSESARLLGGPVVLPDLAELFLDLPDFLLDLLDLFLDLAQPLLDFLHLVADVLDQLTRLRGSGHLLLDELFGLSQALSHILQLP